MWKVNIATFFPEIFPGPLALSVTGKALKEGKWSVNPIQIRDYAKDKHKTVDDTPYGGGYGMVMKPDVLADLIDDQFIPNGAPIYYLSPRGTPFNQKVAKELAELPALNLICGRFEGVDERALIEYKVSELSLGDFVLSAGDLAALPILDSCIRLLPGVLDSEEALSEESFGIGGQYSKLLEYPHYTKPFSWRGHDVPEILRSGNHAEVSKWRLKQAEEKTKIARPDLWDQYNKGD